MGKGKVRAFLHLRRNDEEDALPQGEDVSHPDKENSNDEESAIMLPRGEDVSHLDEENSNDEENAIMLPQVEDLSDLDEVISFIETRLNAILITKPEEESTSEAETNTNSVVTSSIKYGQHLLEKALKRVQKHSSKLLSGETRKVIIDILKETAQIHWVVAGLGVVAYVMDQTNKMSTNRKECIEFLRYMCGLAKQIKQMGEHLNEKKLRDVVVFIVKGSFFCISQMHHTNPLYRFFHASVNAEELKSLQSQLAHTYSDLHMDVVIQILNLMPATLPPTQGEYPNAVGIDEARAKVIKLLDLKDESTRGVVLYGVGGIGKTTLATAVFSSLKLDAYKHCRINIQQDCSDSDLKQLQEQVLKDLFAQKIQLRNCDEGKERLLNCFRKAKSQPVFLLIDNALRGSDLAKLLPNDLSCLPNRSRILITTRKLDETDMIEEGGVKRYEYPVDPLSKAESIKFLCWKALGGVDKFFDKSLDIEGLEKMCGGLPLVLEMVGSKLRKLGNDIRACESTKQFLKDTLLKGEGELSEKVVDGVYNTLQYDVYKDAFLDIVVCFQNWNEQEVGYIVGEVELKAIQEAALIKISEEGEVIVHDIVQARGRKLAEGTRITDHESFQRALEDPQSLEKIKVIWLGYPDNGGEFQVGDKFPVQAKHLELMKRSLRVLHLGYGNKLDGESIKSFFPNVRFLSIACHLEMEQTKFEKLAVLCARLKKLPDSRYLSSLRKLDLRGSKLNCIPKSFGELSCLEELNFSGCNQLHSFPEGFGQLKSLKYLDISFCGNLKKVSDDFGQLSSVCVVDAASCDQLDGKAMDKFLEMERLLALGIWDSLMLTERWREVKARHTLIVLDNEYFHQGYDQRRRYYEALVSKALFDKESRFLQNDGGLQLDEWSPEQGQVAFVWSVCDLSSPSKKAALEMVKEKIAELASQGFQIVCVGQNMECIHKSLVLLPGGTRAWIAPHERLNKLVRYSIYRLLNAEEIIASNLHTVVGSACVSLDEQGERYVHDLELKFPLSGDVEAFKDIDGVYKKISYPIELFFAESGGRYRNMRLDLDGKYSA